MSNEYLQERDIKTIDKSRKLLAELPPYVRQFYDAKKGAKKELTRYAYVLDIKEESVYVISVIYQECQEGLAKEVGKTVAEKLEVS